MPLKNDRTLEPGGIQGPIIGLIDGYTFHGAWNYTLSFHAIIVIYVGVGYAFSAGFYPKVMINRPVHWRNHDFKGVITPTYISGTITGLPYG